MIIFETALENAKLETLEQLKLQIFFFPRQTWWKVDLEVFLWKRAQYLTKPKTPSMSCWCMLYCHLKIWSAKLIPKAVFEVFKLIIHQMQSFYDKSRFYFFIKQYWVIGNSHPVLKKLKRLIIKLMQKLFRHLTFPHFILNDLTLIWWICWKIFLTSQRNILIYVNNNIDLLAESD